MAHPTVKFFGVEVDGEYKMVRCWWRRYPRIENEKGVHYVDCDEPHKITISFFDPTIDQIKLFASNRDKITLETWTAPDCIFDKKQYGQWYNFGERFLHDVTLVQVTQSDLPTGMEYEVQYRFEDLTWVSKTEEIQFSVDGIPDDPDERTRRNWRRRRPTVEDILNHRVKNEQTLHE